MPSIYSKKRKITEVSHLASVFSAASGLSSVKWDKLDKKKRMENLGILADFHTKLVEAAGNDLLIQFDRMITYNLARYQYKYSYKPDTFWYSRDHHKRIFEEIQAEASEGAKSALREHHRAFIEILGKSMREGMA